MKPRLLLLSFLFFSLACAAPLQERRIESDALFELAEAFGISSDQDIVEVAIKRWLRNPSLERWEIQELPESQRQFVLNWARDQGLFADWKPSCVVYDKAVILGATTESMQNRLDYLQRLWIQGIRFEEVVWLTGDRPLDERVDGLTQRCRCESEAARLLWEESDLIEEMKALPVVFVAVPMKGSIRPNTLDTLYAWLSLSPGPCSALFISNQPFCGAQHAIIKAHLPDEIDFDLVGSGIDTVQHPPRAAVILDVIGRWVSFEK